MARLDRWLWPLHVLAEVRGLLFPWVPVFIALGIGLWFALPFEPGPAFYLATGAVVALVVLQRALGGELIHPVFIAIGCVAAGLLASGLRAHLVEAPMLEFHFYGPVQGRIIDIDRSQTDALRLTLDQVALGDVAPARTPLTVRISLHGPPPDMAVEPGQMVLLTAHLAAPEGPSEPGGFDFRRMAFFNQLGAVGYSQTPVVLWAPPEPGTQAINRLRTRLSRAIEAAVPGDAGAFASGVMTGDRSEIRLQTVVDLRVSSLAHLLAISGMNMAFLTGFVFALLRYGLALIPPLALRVNAKKLAAGVAFGVALFYLMLSGANVATTRAFLMVCVLLGAVLFDRRALTMRSVALAATVLLLFQPESLTEPGFQLSFAATVALIAGYGQAQARLLQGRVPGWLMPLATLVLTSVLAGAATAPYAAATFNRFTDYGLIANLLTVPVMSVLMGAGAVAALLAPIGLAAPALWVMELAARWILLVAHWVAGLHGAITPVPAPGPWVMPLITLGAIWVVLWRGRVRLAGLLPLAVGLVLWGLTTRPVLLISSDGVLAGLVGPEGRALSSARGAGFAAESWLQDDGDLALPEAAALRPGFEGPKSARRFTMAGVKGVMLAGKSAAAALPAACAGADLVILPAALPSVSPRPKGCLLIDRAVLEATGAIELRPEPGGLRLIPVRSALRIWMGDRPLLTSVLIRPEAARLAETQ